MTPLESASTPNMERLLQMGMCGNVYPIAPGIPVGTDVGHLQIFGYDSSRVYRGRGPLEASSGGLELMDGDVAFRGNLQPLQRIWRWWTAEPGESARVRSFWHRL